MVAILPGAWSGFAYEWHTQSSWMIINFVLAVVPGLLTLGLSLLGRRAPHLRWLGVGAVVLLLPNAPYVVTDLIHLPDLIRWAPDRAAVLAGVIPMMSILIGSGVLSYAYCLHMFRRALRHRGWTRPQRLAASSVIDLACAVGVALGRKSRLNSWDIFRPFTFLHGLHVVALDPRSVALALIIVVGAGLGVDWVASGAVHSVRDRQHHHRH